MHEPECCSGLTLDLHGCDMVVDPNLQQDLPRLPFGCREIALLLDLDAVGAPFRLDHDGI
jgi:hypothetical protein